MKTPLVYDGRNIYDIGEMKRAGVEYYSVGRVYPNLGHTMIRFIPNIGETKKSEKQGIV